MKGLIARTTCLLGGLIGMVGCANYHDVVDPCYPERYEAQAHQETLQAIAPQVANGHVLDQTVWDSHFKTGTAELTLAGIEHLNYVIRRRPHPDTNLFLQTALMVPTDAAATGAKLVFDPAAPEKLVEARNKLNHDRKEVVERYVVAAAAGRGLAFNVELIDVATPTQNAHMMHYTIRTRDLGTPGGVLPATGGAQPQVQVQQPTTYP